MTKPPLTAREQFQVVRRTMGISLRVGMVQAMFHINVPKYVPEIAFESSTYYGWTLSPYKNPHPNLKSRRTIQCTKMCDPRMAMMESIYIRTQVINALRYYASRPLIKRDKKIPPYTHHYIDIIKDGELEYLNKLLSGEIHDEPQSYYRTTFLRYV